MGGRPQGEHRERSTTAPRRLHAGNSRHSVDRRSVSRRHSEARSQRRIRGGREVGLSEPERPAKNVQAGRRHALTYLRRHLAHSGCGMVSPRVTPS
jgi:hypothetical protein